MRLDCASVDGYDTFRVKGIVYRILALLAADPAYMRVTPGGSAMTAYYRLSGLVYTAQAGYLHAVSPARAMPLALIRLAPILIIAVNSLHFLDFHVNGYPSVAENVFFRFVIIHSGGEQLAVKARLPDPFDQLVWIAVRESNLIASRRLLFAYFGVLLLARLIPCFAKSHQNPSKINSP